MNQKILTALKIILGLGILLFLIFKIGISSFIEMLPNLKIGYLILALLFYPVFLFLSAICLKNLIDVYKKINIFVLFKYFSYAWVVGLLLPSKLGEFSLAYFLKKEGIPVGKGLAISFMDKVITIILFAIITSIGLFLYFEHKFAMSVFIGFAVAGIIFLVIVILLFSNMLMWILPKSIKNHFAEFKASCLLFIKKWPVLLSNFILTCIRWLANNVMIILIFLSLGFKVDFFIVLVVTVMASLISLIPITIGGLGVRQAVSVGLFKMVGVNDAAAMSMLIIQLTSTYLVALLIFLIALKRGDYFGKISTDTS